jgi:exodeoxyribonuclease VII large subunit
MDIMNHHITLSELVSEISETLSERFYGKSYWIVAETSDIKNYPDRGYCFATLIEKEGKDVLAKMEAVIWRREYPIISNFEFVTGTRFDRNLKLLLNVEVVFNPVYGLRLEIIDIDTAFTLGQLELERQEIVRRLVAENPGIIRLVDGNFITYNKTLSTPLVIQHIALITAPGSDGLRDFLHELGSNPYGYKFTVTQYLTQIQGKNADQLIIRQLTEIEASDNRIDVVVIVRGGGSQLDFGAFETYDIGKAIAGYGKIIITGIGHERNVSIADLMSNNNLKTPTKAASFIIDHNRAFEEEVVQLQEQITSGAEELLIKAADAIDLLKRRFIENCRHFLERANNEIEKHTIAVKHLSPENILGRGFAIVSRNNRIVVDPEQLQPGEEIIVTMQNASILSTVKSIEK